MSIAIASNKLNEILGKPVCPDSEFKFALVVNMHDSTMATINFVSLIFSKAR